MKEVPEIYTCFMPAESVLKQAAALQANLVVAYEGAFYHAWATWIWNARGLASWRGTGEAVQRQFPSSSGMERTWVLFGEGPEWETPEYVRDALHQGRIKGLVVLGPGPVRNRE